MFSVKSPTFSKLKCPYLNNCSYGPDLCIFSHDPNVYIKGGLDGKIGLSSMTYFKELYQRIRTEDQACSSSELFSNEKAKQENSSTEIANKSAGN